MNYNRRCDNCGSPLAGKKGHGFLTRDLKGVWCSTCMFPKKKGEKRR